MTGPGFMTEKNKCPCAAVAELIKMVELLEKRVDKNENNIKDDENKLNKDYTKLQIITKDMTNIVSTMEKIQNQIVDLVEERRKKELKEQTDFKRRIHSVTDEVIKWCVLLLLSFVAVKLGFNGGVL